MNFKNLINSFAKQIKNEDSISLIDSIHFGLKNINKILLVSIIAFFITFYITGFYTTKVDAFDVTDHVKPYNQEVIEVSYGNLKQHVNIVKDILKEKISVLSEAKLITNTDQKTIFEIDDYVADVELNSKKLFDNEITVRLMKKDTYYSGNKRLAEFYCQDGNVTIVDGMVCLYRVIVNVKDTTAPSIVLTNTSITLNHDDSFNPGAYIKKISDNFDGSIYDYEVDGNDVGSNGNLKAGKHTLTYRVSDSSGNVSEAKLVVKVKEKVVVNTYKPNYTTASNVYAGNIVSEARKYIGYPYVWGGNGPTVFDCSGFVQYVYKKAGVYVPRTSGSQAHYGKSVNPYDRSQWRAGDIITFGPYGSEHAAIYSGNGTLIHALNPSAGVVETGIFGNIYSVRRP